MQHRSKLIRISSHHRQAGQSHSKFTVHMGTELQEIHKIKKITLSTVIFNNNHYNINPSNNTFVYKIGVTEKSMTITPGIYNTTTLVAAIIVAEPAFAITQSVPEAKLIFTNADFQVFSVDDRPASTMSPHLGIHTTSPVNSTTFTVDSIPELNGLDMVFIKSSKLSQGNLIDSDTTNHNYLSAIPVVAPFGTNSVYHETHISEVSGITYRKPINLSSIDIEMVDHNHKPVYLQGELIIVLKIYF
jgi:hypothetical protein